MTQRKKFALCMVFILVANLPAIFSSASILPSAPGFKSPAKDSPTSPLASMLNADGTLNLKTGFSGSLNASGWRMETTESGEPRFIQQSPQAAGDEKWDTQFNNPGANSTVNVITINGSDIYFGGGFTAIGNIAANRIARWNTTTNTWSAFGNGVSHSVYAIAISGADIYVGGDFTTVIGVSGTPKIAKWNTTTSTWSALGTGADNAVNALAFVGSDLYAAGLFSSMSGVSGTSRIAKWNGSSWSAVGTGTGANLGLNSLAVNGTDLYIGGGVTNIHGVAVSRVAKYATTTGTWSALGNIATNSLNNSVNALAISGGFLYVGGSFTSVTGVSGTSGIARFNLTTNTWSTVGGGVSGTVFALGVNGSDIYVGGNITLAGGGSVNRVARFDGSSWSALGTLSNNGVIGESATVNAFAASGGFVYVGGFFSNAGNGAGNCLARWNGSSWSAIISGNGIGSNGLGAVNAIAVNGTDVYVGGRFTGVGGIPANGIAKWNGTTWSAMGTGLVGIAGLGIANAIAVNGTDVYVGGFFSTAGGVSANNIAKWNGTSWSALGSPTNGVNNEVKAIAVNSSGEVYVGGAFTAAGGASVNRIARWSGTSWSALGSPTNGVDSIVNAIAASGTDIYVGGQFTTAGGGSAIRIAKWNGTSWSAMGSGIGNTVRAIAVNSADLYVGGDFTGGVARWNGTSWVALGSGVNGIVNAIGVNGADVYVGGFFTTAGGSGASHIARWDGANWTTLGSGMSGEVKAIKLTNSDAFVGGSFLIAGIVPSTYFAKYQIATSFVSSSSTDWHTASNWGGGQVPSATDDINLPGGGITDITSTDVTARNLTVASGRTLNINAGRTLTVNGSLNVAGTIAGSGTLIFNGSLFEHNSASAIPNAIFQGSAAQTIAGNGNGTFTNLTINNSVGVTLAANLAVNGALNLTTDLNTGSFVLIMPNSATSTGAGDVVGNVKRTGIVNGSTIAFGNVDNNLTFNSGTPPADVTINLAKSMPSSITNVINRLYTISPNGGIGYAATLRLRYLDSEIGSLNENNLHLWRYNGSAWEDKNGTVNTANNYVEATGISTFSPWAIATPAAPTAITLIQFQATAFDDGAVLEWQTGFEVDNLGFNIHKESSGTLTKINAQLIAGSALQIGSHTPLASGGRYSLWDASLAGCKTADCQNQRYWLEDVDLSGESTWHGPFLIQHLSGRASLRAQSESFSKLAESSSPTKHSQMMMPVAKYPASEGSAISLQPILASGKAIKIAINHPGWFRISKAELIAAGLDERLDPRRLQLFVDGREIPCIVTGEQDGHLDDGDGLEFYGLGLDTPATDKRIYWLVVSPQFGKRLNKIANVKGLPLNSSFPCTVERQDRFIYFSALQNGEAENFFGSLVLNNPTNQRLTLKDLGETKAVRATLEVALQGVTAISHRVSVNLNGSLLGFMQYEAQQAGKQTFSFPQALLREGENIVTLQSLNTTNDFSLVNYIRLTYPRRFNADNDELNFNANPGEQITVSGFTAKAVRVFDITDGDNPLEIEAAIEEGSAGYSATFTASGKGERRLFATVIHQAEQAVYLKADVPSRLQHPSNAADFLIITNGRFVDSLKTLAETRNQQGLRTLIVDLEDIFDEFAFGHKSPQAIKDFLSYANRNWRGRPRALMLVGDASYDQRNYLGFGEQDLMPTKIVGTQFLETASDDWFADFNGDGISDLPVGRLPVRTVEEVERVVRKLIAYETASPSREMVLVADHDSQFNFEQASQALRQFIPRQISVQEIFRSQMSDATAKAELLAAIQRGQKLINYSGHGSSAIWRGHLLTTDDVPFLTGIDHPAVFVNMTCLNGYFSDALIESLAEALIKADGGAIAVWSSSAMTPPQSQALMNQAFYRALFNGGRVTFGEAAQQAKAAIQDLDCRKSWNLLGDPTMKIR
ncbi:MAG: C25 family cysteine peptidase [Acidobacteriota bacterium]